MSNTLGIIRSSAAPVKVSGIASNNIPLRDMIVIYEDGEPMTLSGLEFEYTFRACEGATTGKLTCTTDTGDGLIITTATIDGVSTPVLQFDDVDVSDLRGDYIADLLMKDGDGDYTLLAHGVVTFRNEPAIPTI